MAMNVEGRYYRSPHHGWGQSAEELFFHSSRYVVHTGDVLQRLCGCGSLQLNQFRASRMSKEQRGCMAEILSMPPSGEAAAGVVAIIEAVAQGDKSVPPIARSLCSEPFRLSRPFMQLAASRPRCSTGLSALAPTEPIKHLGKRYGFPVRIERRIVWLDCKRCNRFLNSGNHLVSRNMLEALQCLNRAGYEVRNSQIASATAANF